MAKMMMCIACAIILLHTFVPHHHHDVEGGEGFVLESELVCNDQGVCCHGQDCHHNQENHDQESHHPFDICKLQQLLSQLVLNERDDKFFVQSSLQPLHLDLAPWNAIVQKVDILASPSEPIRWEVYDEALPSVLAPIVYGLRAPPMC